MKFLSMDNGIRCLHAGLTVGIFCLMLGRPSDLKTAWVSKSPSFFVLTALLVLSLVCYALASFINPGYLPLNNSTESSSVKIEQSSSYCRLCKHIKPLRTKHCFSCGFCVRKFDHHCPWLGNCVGEHNHRYFLLFLILETPVTVWGSLIAWSAVRVPDSGVSSWLTDLLPTVLSLIVLSVAGIITALLCFYHTYLMLTGQTTWEQASRATIPHLREQEGNPFNQGCLQNMASFVFPGANWEEIYQRTCHQHL